MAQRSESRVKALNLCRVSKPSRSDFIMTQRETETFLSFTIETLEFQYRDTTVSI